MENTEYLVVTCGIYGGEWARGDDLTKLYRKVRSAVETKTVVVKVYRTSSDRSKTWVDDFGSVCWEHGFAPERVGLMCISRGGKAAPVVKGQFSPDHPSHEEWTAKQPENQA